MDETDEVEIEITSTIPPGRSQKGLAAYIIAAQAGNGKRAQAGKRIAVETTRNEALLIALEEALSRLNRPVLLTIRTEDGYIRTGCERIRIWRGNDWKASEKRELKNRQRWVTIDAMLKKHSWRVAEGNGEITAWMNDKEKKGE